MNDEPPGINQTSLRGLTQPCRAPSSEQGCLPAGKGAENSYPSLPPTPVPPHPSLCSCKPPEPQLKCALSLSLSLSLSPLPVFKATREKPTLPLPFPGVTPVPGSGTLVLPPAHSSTVPGVPWGRLAWGSGEMWGAEGWRRQGKGSAQGRECGGSPGREPRGGDMEGTSQREAWGWGPEGNPEQGTGSHLAQLLL